MSEPFRWAAVGRHALLADTTHDERARFDAIAHFARFLADGVAPAVRTAYETRASAAYRQEHGHEPANRAEASEALAADPSYQAWSALRRGLMENRQLIGRMVVLRQADALAAKARELNTGQPTLRLDASFSAPRYLSAVDIHCMPGGYVTERIPEDVTGPANYDAGIFATVGGTMGPYSDGAGRALVEWLQQHEPQFRPRRIVDLGCGIGHNTLPLAQAFPESDIVAIDAAAPMLRYGHARARSLGIENVTFLQADATDVPLESGAADLVFTSMVLHETSRAALPRILHECARLLRPGGLTLHLEQPPYRGRPPFEQAMRDWDGRYNNEPFWSGLHETDLPVQLAASGFARDAIFETEMIAPPVDGRTVAERKMEDYGRTPRWYVVGARRRSTDGSSS
jgi:SAM-dependent methyltransferase